MPQLLPELIGSTKMHLSQKGIAMKRNRLSEILLAEGLTWRQEEPGSVRASILTSSVEGDN